MRSVVRFATPVQTLGGMGEKAIRCAVLLVVWFAAVDAGKKGSNEPVGVGAYAYQDTSGNRYGGTYDIDAEDLQNLVYAPGFPAGFPGFPAHFTDFLRQLESSVGPNIHGFGSHRFISSMPYNHFQDIGQQHARAGMQYAQQFVPGFGPHASSGGSSSYSGSSSYGGPGNGRGNFGHDYAAQGMNFPHPHDGNSAYASGSVGPDGIRQVASINPGNPGNPNIDISSRSSGGNGGFYSVSSSSYASSSDNGGRKTSNRGAKTVVNDNGNVKEYEVHN